MTLVTTRRGWIVSWTLLGLVMVAGAFTSSKILAQNELPKAEPHPDVPTSAESAPKEKDTAKVADDKKNAVLTVFVTGNGRPLLGAEVKMKFPSSIGGEATRHTDEDGQVIFKSSATGSAKVRVIADGWQEALTEVTLKKGPQNVTVKVSSLEPSN